MQLYADSCGLPYLTVARWFFHKRKQKDDWYYELRKQGKTPADIQMIDKERKRNEDKVKYEVYAFSVREKAKAKKMILNKNTKKQSTRSSDRTDS